jgi:hypothetical protein
MKIALLPPVDLMNGNLLWNKGKSKQFEQSILTSLDALRGRGYGASCFPEGDGITFSHENKELTVEQIFTDVAQTFSWATVKLNDSHNGNEVLADLHPSEEMRCLIAVPLDKIKIEATFEFSRYRFVCRIGFDPEPWEREASYECEYLEFEADLNMADLLRLNQTFEHNNKVIEKCLSLAEEAMDVVRFIHGSFMRPEFTPNPAGQIDEFTSVEITPLEKTHMKWFDLSGKSRPLSVVNNWLGPELDLSDFNQVSIVRFSEILDGADDELSIAIKNTLRNCRQSFYSLGNESKFLNLVFALDAVACVPKNTKGDEHRRYISALLSRGESGRFSEVLEKFSHLYSHVRNPLVHHGKSFYELPEQANEVSEQIYRYIKQVIELIANENFRCCKQVQAYANKNLKCFAPK